MKNHKNDNNNTMSFYDPLIHYPHLLVLCKLRNFNEDLDQKAARKHMEERNNSNK